MRHLATLLPCLLLALSARAEEAPAAADAGWVKVPGGTSVKLGGETASCLECHAEEGMAITLKSGEELNLTVDPAVLAGSTHAHHGCADCHIELKGTEGGHPKKRLGSARDFTVEYSKSCAACHVETGKKMQDGVHARAQAAGNAKAAVCADCHGGHAARRPDKLSIEKTCARCHPAVAEAFVKSVHGAGLYAGNPDVPSCTNCHASHEIQRTRDPRWRSGQPETCGGCHADEKLMKKYRLSPNVLKTYLADFHGTTVSLLRGTETPPVTALCSDCHGVHDIARTHDPDSKVLAGNLVRTCQKCHPDANDSFPRSWLSHYEPTWEKAPLVFAVDTFYKVLIPFMMAGLFLQMGLHFRKARKHR